MFLIEADYALKYVDTDYTMPIADLGITDADLANQYQYTKDIVTDSKGVLKGVSWICTFLSGLIIASAFSSIVVYATDLMPDKVGLIAGIFFGLMFGLGGLGSAFFGWLADKTSIEFIFQVSAFLPLLGIIAGFLPNTQKRSVEKTDEKRE